jgi:hypothetical protein
MRAREILGEDYNASLQSDLNNLLVAAKANGSTSINTVDLVNQLYSSGYSVSIQSVIPMLTSNPMVMNVTPDTVELASPSVAGADQSQQTQDSAAQVTDMAQKATKIG